MGLDRRTTERQPPRLQRERAWAAIVFFVGLLLFVWPFVREPPLSMGLSYAHLLVSWALVAAALHAVSRPRRGRRGRRGADHG